MQLGNHLGNVLVTISDRKKGVADPLNAALIKFFEPVMLSGTDYYPFGMAIRVGGDNKYKYGFNGKENDNDVKGGVGSQQDYGMRVYDNRLGRFLSVDPLTSAFPWYTPYQFAGNSPIANIDLDGAEPKPAGKGSAEGESQTTTHKVFRARGSYEESKEWFWHAGGLTKTDGTKTAADYYSSEDYVKVLQGTNAAATLARELNLYSSAALNSQKYMADLGQSELSAFGENGLNANASNHLIAAAKVRADKANFNVTGTTYTSGFNIEDILGVGIFIKQGFKYLGGVAAKKAVTEIAKDLPTQIHHFATNKSKTWTPQMEAIAKRFNLGLDEAWNKAAMPHLGRHPNDYHKWVLQNMQKAELEASGSQAKFLELFDSYIKQPVLQNPSLLRKSGWK